jgi:DNA-binding transcriptional MerR regulator
MAQMTDHSLVDEAELSAGTGRRVFSITELTREFSITTRTLRFYEAEGMLSPMRRGRRRLFSQRDRTRLKLILRGKRLGFSLADIREIIDMHDAEPGEKGQLTYLVERISGRRAELAQKQNDIELTLAELGQVEEKCLQRLAQLEGVDE